MKALVLSSPAEIQTSPLNVLDRELQGPGAEEIRVGVSVCGLCHTDLHTVEGDLELPELPIVPGHQVVGVIDAVGDRVDRFERGDRVGIAWLRAACGLCRFCREGDENLCEEARFTGFHADGGYAEAALVHQDFAYPIPEVFLDAEAAPLLCAGIIGYRALRLSEVKPGQRLGLYGFGASAHIVAQIARHWSCEVYVYTRSQGHQALAQELGAVWVGRAEDEPPARMDSSIIFAPAGHLVPEALRVLEKGGTLALAGISMSPIPEMGYEEYLYHEKTVRSVTASTRRDGEELLKLAADIRIKPHTTLFPIREANEALQQLKAGAIDGAGVLQVADGF